MIVAVVGSEHYPDLDEVRSYVKSLPPGTIFISGGGPGVDTVAEEAARAIGLKVEIYAPDHARHGTKARSIRNAALAKRCDRMVAFWDGQSSGTMQTVGYARRRGKLVEVKSRAA